MSLEKYTQFFNKVDANGDGSLSLQELQAAMKHQGYSRRQVESIFRTADTSGDNQMSLEEFLVVMGECDPKVHRQAAMLSVCRSFDTDNSGDIDCHELKSALDEMRGQGYELTKEEQDKVFKLVDLDGDGKVTYKELLQTLFGYDIDG